jgi:beta-mannosidase
MDLSGAWRACSADDEVRRTGVGIEFDDSAWVHVPVPGHWRTTPELADDDGPVLHRVNFHHRLPGDGERVFVTLHGIFYQADVWLDGAYLGDPEGYFAPHSFDITSLARLAPDHVLAVEVACSPQRDERAKRTLTGAFQDPRRVGPDWNPGGIWRPVTIDVTGPVRIDRCRVLCRDANATRAHLRVTARLDSDRARTVRVRTVVGGITRAEQDHSLARGDNDISWNLDLAKPALWWPWSMGDQPLTDVRVEVLVDGHESHRHDVRTGLREIAFDDWVCSVNGERLYAKGAQVGPTCLDVAHATPDELRRDVELAREAGLDLIRLTSHIARPELYSAADELGVLIWQDLPLVHGYARSVRRQAVQQARDAVDLLGHHPSIAVWCAHDTPETTVRRQQLPTWNKTILDRWVKRALEQADESRPVIAARGCPRTCHNSRAPTRTSGSAGVVAPTATWPRSRPRCRAWCASSASSAPSRCPTPPRTSTPRHGPTSTGTCSSSTTGCSAR